MKMQAAAAMGALAILGAAWLSMGTGEAQTPSLLTAPFTSETSSISVTLADLRYRLHVMTDRPVPDGTFVQVSRLLDPRPDSASPQDPCAKATVQGGIAEVTVLVSDDCPERAQVGITLFFPAQVPISATSDPPLEWRTARSDDPAVIDAVVRPIPPHTAGERVEDARFAPPATGSGGLCCFE